MPRQPLYLIIPTIAVVAALVLFFQRDRTGNAPAASSSSGSLAVSAAQMPSNTSMNPTPSGTASPSDPNGTPASATPRAPSGEPARPAERR
jgi:hypothetical protein